MHKRELGLEAATRFVRWEKMFLEISQNSQENTSARTSFLIQLQAWDSGTGVFLWVLRNFWEYLFYRRPLDDSFCRFNRILTIFSILVYDHTLFQIQSLFKNSSVLFERDLKNLHSLFHIYHVLVGKHTSYKVCDLLKDCFWWHRFSFSQG